MPGHSDEHSSVSSRCMAWPSLERDALAELVKSDRPSGWLQPRYADLPEQLSAYMAFEAEAAAVRNYEAVFVPGLLQTEAYAHAVVRGVLPEASDDDVDQRVQARLERQGLLAKPDPLRLWAIIDEAALRRTVGGSKVMREQLRHLVEIGAAPHVTLQVIPYAAGAHPGMPGSFVVMSFADPADPEIVYLDSMAGDLFLETQADVTRFGGVFDHLRAAALSPQDSRTFIERMERGDGRAMNEQQGTEIDLTAVVWRKSSYSSGNGQCVEVARLVDGSWGCPKLTRAGEDTARLYRWRVRGVSGGG